MRWARADGSAGTRAWLITNTGVGELASESPVVLLQAASNCSQHPARRVLNPDTSSAARRTPIGTLASMTRERGGSLVARSTCDAGLIRHSSELGRTAQANAEGYERRRLPRS